MNLIRYPRTIPQDPIIIEPEELWLDASVCTWHKTKFEKLNPIQSAVIPFADQDVNLVVCAATSAGKTLTAEILMSKVLQAGRKAAFLSPLKAVTREKWEDWKDESHPWKDLNKSIVSGDYQLTEARKKELAQAHVICMTSEMLDSRTRRIESEQNNWLLELGILVCDEAHLITMPERGDKLESALMRFSLQNQKAKIVLLSATMPNVKTLAKWLSQLNGKQTVVITSSWRPCQLDIHWEQYQAGGEYKNWLADEANKLSAAIRTVQSFPDDKFIVFVHSKNNGNQLRGMMESSGIISEFHSADLGKEQRITIEKQFKQKGGLRVLIATSTLSYGINMPARRVIICGSKRGLDYVHPIDIRQMVGRSGRVGFDPKGDAHILLSSLEFEREKKRLENLPMIESQMLVLDVLAFHLVAEIAEGFCSSREEISAWYNRSFAKFSQAERTAQSNSEAQLDDVIERLSRRGIITFSQGKGFKATGLGRVASWLYYSPFDIGDWASNLNQVAGLNMLQNDAALSWALGVIHTEQLDGYVPKALQNDLMLFNAIVPSQLRMAKVPQSAKAVAYFKALNWSSEESLSRGWGSFVREIRYDADRIVGALKLIDKFHWRWNHQDWEKLAARLKYGCSWEEAGMCNLFDGIGAVRAKKLSQAGIKTAEDIITRRNILPALLGKRTADSLIEQAEQAVQVGKK